MRTDLGAMRSNTVTDTTASKTPVTIEGIVAIATAAAFGANAVMLVDTPPPVAVAAAPGSAVGAATEVELPFAEASTIPSLASTQLPKSLLVTPTSTPYPRRRFKR